MWQIWQILWQIFPPRSNNRRRSGAVIWSRELPGSPNHPIGRRRGSSFYELSVEVFGQAECAGRGVDDARRFFGAPIHGDGLERETQRIIYTPTCAFSLSKY